MTPVNLVRHNSLELQQFGGECVDDSLSMDTQDIVDQPAFSITEIAVRFCALDNLHAFLSTYSSWTIDIDFYDFPQVMNDEDACFKYQAQFGREYNEDDFLIFNVAVRYPETVVSSYVILEKIQHP